MKRFAATLLILPASLAAQPAPVTPPSPAAQASPATIVVQGQKEKKVCHDETSTGSIMPKRVCLTQAQIAAQQTAAQNTVEALRKQRETEQQVSLLRGSVK